MKLYTGIGSRETPSDVLSEMRHIAEALANKGWTLRSGCAPGADSAFESGAKSAMGTQTMPELYLPWSGFEDRGDDGWSYHDSPSPAATVIAANHHPNWANLSQGAKKLYARNVHQILGADPIHPVPSRFVICWTKDGGATGGTGQAIRLAEAFSVPVFNMFFEDVRVRLGNVFKEKWAWA